MLSYTAVHQSKKSTLYTVDLLCREEGRGREGVSQRGKKQFKEKKMLKQEFTTRGKFHTIGARNTASYILNLHRIIEQLHPTDHTELYFANGNS